MDGQNVENKVQKYRMEKNRQKIKNTEKSGVKMKRIENNRQNL